MPSNDLSLAIALLGVRASNLIDIVEAVRALPYGRPSDRSVTAMLRERRGTCSTKHLLLAAVLAERFPATEPQIMHRVYRLEPAQALAMFGEDAARTVPPGGLTDVHRYLTIRLRGRRVTIDATFPGADGASSLPLACGPGTDEPAGADPDADKRALESRYCDPPARERFIAALSS